MKLRAPIVFADGTTQSTAATGGGAAISQTEIDFGAAPTSEQEFTIVDAAVKATSRITAEVAYEAPADGSKLADEATMDSLDIVCQPAAGSFKLYAACLTGKVYGKFKINYMVG